jgi:membrane protein required for colicin V production
LLSAVFGLMRGFMREMLSLASWIVAFLVAGFFSHALAVHFGDPSSHLVMKESIAFGVLFVVVLGVGLFVSYLLGQLVNSTGLSFFDRLLGLVFGLLRGLIFMTVVVFLVAMTATKTNPAWQSSQLVPQFKKAALAAKTVLPMSMADKLKGLAMDTIAQATQDNAVAAPQDSDKAPTSKSSWKDKVVTLATKNN